MMASKATTFRDSKGRRLYERTCPACDKPQSLARKELVDRECLSCAKAEGKGFPPGTLVDPEFKYLEKWSWHLNSAGYVTHATKGELHRVVLGLKRGDGKEVGHRNHIKLDCRKENLRLVTHSENQLEMWEQRRLKNV